jgi:hypothetical protein
MQIPPEARTWLKAEDLLGDYQATFIDRLWIALVAVEAGIILGILVYRVLQLRSQKTRARLLSISMLPS